MLSPSVLESGPMQRTRVVSVAYLNAMPLTWGLTRGSLRETVEVVSVPPCDACGLLTDTRADVALIPSIELARSAGLTPVPGTGIAAAKEVRSVLLLSRVEPAAIRTLAADSNSRTSVALSLVMLKRRYRCRPQVDRMPPDPARMLLTHDAALVIGDAALKLAGNPPREAPFVIDLADAWHAMTGLPFVFALWACRPVVSPLRLSEMFEQSLEEGLANIDVIAREESARVGIPEAVIASYLRENIRFRLGHEEMSSLRMFFSLCREDGLLNVYAPPRPASRSVAVKSG
jgi:chorismate dehydratase